MPATRGFMSKKHSTKGGPLSLEVWKAILGFIVGGIVWHIWMSILRFFFIRCEVYIEPYAYTGQGKVALLFLRALGLTIFPILGVYVAEYFTETKGLYVLCALGACTFFIQLTCPHESDPGSVDMVEGIHLPILPQLKLPFYLVSLVSIFYYLGKFVFLGVQEGISCLNLQRL